MALGLRAGVVVLALAPTLALLVPSCREPTQVMLTITTDIPCALDGSASYALQSTLVDVAGADGWDTVASPKTCAERIGTLTFVPGGRDEVSLSVRGQVIDGTGASHEVTASRRVRFVSHQSLPLTVRLSASCLDIRCPDPATQTCQDGVCVDNGVTADGGLSLDGGFVPDVSKDAPFVVKDSGILDAIPIDDGPLCPAIIGVGMGVKWPFDEGTGTTTYNSNMVPTSLGMGSTFVPGACNTALSVAAATAQKLAPQSGAGSANFAIGFFLKAGNTTFNGVPFLLRGDPQAPPAWSLALVQGGQIQVTYTVTTQSSYKYQSLGTVKTNTFTPVVFVSNAVSGTLTVAGATNTFLVPMGFTDPANAQIVLSGPVVVDELELRN